MPIRLDASGRLISPPALTPRIRLDAAGRPLSTLGRIRLDAGGRRVEDEQDDNPWYEDLGIMAARVVPAVAGGLIGSVGGPVGTLAGGAAGGALGEYLAQLYEKADKRRADINPASIGVAGALGAIPLGKAAGFARGALKGATMGAGATTGFALSERGELPGVGELALGAGTGGVLGGGVSALARRLRVAPQGAGAATEAPAAPSALTPQPKGMRYYLEADQAIRRPERPIIPSKKPIHAGIEQRAEDPWMAEAQRTVIERNPALRQKRTRGRVPVQQVLEDAQTEPITTIKVGKAFDSPERYIAFERRNKLTWEQFNDLAMKRARGGLSEADEATFKTLARTFARQEAEVYGGRAETARTMRMMQVKIAGQVRSVPERGIKTALDMGLTDAEIADLMTRAGADGDAWIQGLRQEASKRQTVGQKIASMFTGNILSGPPTQARNIGGNVGNLATKPVLTPLRALLDRGAPGEKTIYAGEVGAQMRGAAGSAGRALRAFKDVMTKGYSMDVLESTGGLDRARVEFAGGGKNPWNVVGRLLEGTDVLFRTLSEGMETQGMLYTMARNQAVKEGVSAKSGRFAEILRGLQANVPEDVVLAAKKAAARTTFQEDPGQAITTLMQAKANHPWLQYLIPFVKTPANLIRQGFEFTPAGFFMKGAKAAEVGQRAATEVQARAAAGTVGLGALFMLAMNGRLSGNGPSDPAEKARLYEAGWRPNAVKIGDTWVSYGMLQPFAVPAALVANAYDAWERSSDPDKEKQIPTIIGETMMATAGSILDQSFLAGLAGFVEALQEPERYLESWGTRTAQGFVPMSGFLRGVQRAKDPVIRRPENMVEGIKSGLPGLSGSVHPRLDRFGQPVKRMGADRGGLGALARLVSPAEISPTVHDPVAEAMLNAEQYDIQPAQPVKEVTIGRQPVKLGSEDAFQLGQAKGQAIYRLLLPIISRPDFKQLPPNVQHDILERLVQRARTQATRQTVGSLVGGR